MDVPPPDPPVLEDDEVVEVTPVDVVLEFELVDGVELPQAARPSARATDANPNKDRVFRLIPLGPGSCDINDIRGPRFQLVPWDTSEGVDLFIESPTF